MVQPLWKTVWQLLRKLKTITPHGLAIPLVGLYQRIKSRDTKGYVVTHVHGRIIHKSLKEEATQASILG